MFKIHQGWSADLATWLLGCVCLIMAASALAAPGNLVQSVTVTNTYDANGYGNLVSVDTVSVVNEPDDNGGAISRTYAQRTVNTYAHVNAAVWDLGWLICTQSWSSMPMRPGLLDADLVSSTSTRLGYVLSGPKKGLIQTQVTGPTVAPSELVPTIAPSTCVDPWAATAVTTAMTYDDIGNMLSKTLSGADFQSRITSYGYDDSGRFINSVSNAQGQTETRTYDPVRGQQTSQKDANQLTTVWEYDDLGRKEKEIRPDGTYTTYVYNLCGSCESREKYSLTLTNYRQDGSRIDAPVTVYYNSLDMEIRRITTGDSDKKIALVRKNFNELGQLTADYRPHYYLDATTPYTRSFVYDALGRLSRAFQSGNYTTYSYPTPFEVHTTNALGQTRIEHKDGLGRTRAIIDAAGNKLSYLYDIQGNLRKTIDAKNNTIEMVYNRSGHKTSMTDPDLGSWTYGYDLLGQLKTQTDAEQQVSTYEYDLLGRLLHRTEVGLDSYWEYDTASGKGLGQLARVYSKMGDGSVDYERIYGYDALGRQSSVTTTKRIEDPAATAATPDFSYTMTYDDAGRKSALTYPTGFGYVNVYDSNGYLTEVRNKDDGSLYWRAVTRDADGRVTRAALGNGLVTDRAYKATTGYLDTVKTGTLSGSTLSATVQNDAYGFDALGNLTLRSQYAGSATITETLGYDNLNRLTTVTPLNGIVRTSSYDEIGNILNRSDVGAYSYSGCGGAHRVCSILGAVNTSFSYDANGNLESGNGRSLTWNAANYPTQIVQGSTTETFMYSPERERVLRISKENGQTTTTVYLNPRMDLGGTFEKIIKPDSTVEYVHHVYAGSEAVGSVVTTAPISTATLWSTDLSAAPTTTNPNPVGLTMPTVTADPNALITWDNSTGNGRLAFATKTLASGSSTPIIKGQRNYLNDNVVYRGEVTPTANTGSNGRYFLFRVSNEGSTAAASKTARWHGLYLRGNITYANTGDGTATDASGNLISVNKNLNYAVTAGVTYVVELETTSTSSDLYFYPKGQPRSAGVRHAVLMDWRSAAGTLKRRWLGYATASTTEAANVTYLDNLSETRFTATEPRYFHGDHQGNLMAVTDTTGTVTERLSYDAWGKRRNPDGSDDAVTTAWTSDLSVQPTTATTNSAKLTMPAATKNIATPTTQNTNGSIIAWDSTGQRLRVSALNNTASVYPAVWGQNKYGKVNVTFRAEVTTGSNSGSGRYLTVEAFNNGTTTAQTQQRFGAYFRGATLYAYTVDYVWDTVNSTYKLVTTTPQIGTVSDNTTYVVEVATTPTLATVYVYPLGQTRGQGVSYSKAVNWVGSAGTLVRNLWIQGFAGTGQPDITSLPAGTNTVYVDNLAETVVTPQQTVRGVKSKRGYTLHEHLDTVGLIHMNGRVYDPQVGRFMSADPNVFYPENMQDYNRYSYVLNNPLGATDPSGFTSTQVIGLDNPGGGTLTVTIREGNGTSTTTVSPIGGNPVINEVLYGNGLTGDAASNFAVAQMQAIMYSNMMNFVNSMVGDYIRQHMPGCSGSHCYDRALSRIGLDLSSSYRGMPGVDEASLGQLDGGAVPIVLGILGRIALNELRYYGAVYGPRALAVLDDVVTGGAAGGGGALVANGGGRSFWNRTTDFNGTRVYQRDDLINPSLLDPRDRTNLERMQKGLAPIGPDGKSMNLHHTLQSMDSPLAEMTQTFHKQNHGVIHINPSTIPSGIDRAAFDKFRSSYWINRAKDFE